MQYDKLGIYDVYGQLAVPFWQTKFFIASMIILFLVMIISIFFVWYKYFKRVRKVTILESLQMLRNRINRSRDDEINAALVYFELITVLKITIKKNHPQVEKGFTDEELYLVIHKSDFIKTFERANEFSAFFNRAMLARFATEQGQKQQLLTDVDFIVFFLNTIEQCKAKK
jgi:hypothetical protein